MENYTPSESFQNSNFQEKNSKASEALEADVRMESFETENDVSIQSVRKKERPRMRKDFALGTSCHGLSQFYSTRSKAIRFVWFILILTVCALLISQVVDRLRAYFSYGTQVQVSEKFVDELQFPAITICNFNRYFNVSGEERQALNTISLLYDYGNINGIQQSNQTEETIRFFDQQEDDFNLTSYLISKAWQLEKSSVQFCFIGGFRTCTSANFTPSFSPSTGQCWTLDTDAVQQKRGVIQGFHLIVFVDQEGYSENFLSGKNEVGILFHVHPKHEPQNVKEVGQSVGVGLWGTVAMRENQVTNMYEPWGNCDPSNEQLKVHSTYSVSACMKECFDEELIERCQCRDPSIVGFSGIRECTPVEVISCSAPIRSFLEVAINPDDCGCTQACRETRYRTSISYATFPNMVTAKELQSALNGSVSLQYLRENFVGLTFYFHDLSVSTTVERKAITESALLSDIGGQLGLWIGISVITLCEFIQFFIKLIQTI